MKDTATRTPTSELSDPELYKELAAALLSRRRLLIEIWADLMVQRTYATRSHRSHRDRYEIRVLRSRPKACPANATDEVPNWLLSNRKAVLLNRPVSVLIRGQTMIGRYRK